MADAAAPRPSVFVTVGMGPWRFDRLVSAVAPLTDGYDVFVQTGTSQLRPPCPHAHFLGFEETQRRLAEADVVVTHAGNTVRLVQRLGNVPVVVAREQRRGEMRNDHQVRFLKKEEQAGRVVALWGDRIDLVAGVREQARVSRGTAAPTPPPAVADAALVSDLLDRLAFGRGADPALDRHPTARYGWAFDQLAGRTGRHLDLGIGDATFLRAIHERTALDVVGADPHGGYLHQARRGHPPLPVVQFAGQLPFSDAVFDSVSMLDVLEHTPDDAQALADVHRVLRPGGLLVMSVPAAHVFSFLDPDNAKFRYPHLHQLVYESRFGRQRYRERFVDAADGLRGDMAWARTEHTNYSPARLLTSLRAAGFVPQIRDGANLFWRFLQVPALLAPPGLSRLTDAPLRLDARVFHTANLFVTAHRAEG
jgi:SAM-dependent methyltransferase/UDP-N-acetylglucosamine transferase subunit ALG13